MRKVFLGLCVALVACVAAWGIEPPAEPVAVEELPAAQVAAFIKAENEPPTFVSLAAPAELNEHGQSVVDPSAWEGWPDIPAGYMIEGEGVNSVKQKFIPFAVGEIRLFDSGIVCIVDPKTKQVLQWIGGGKVTVTLVGHRMQSVDRRGEWRPPTQ